jgi:AAA domain-containing protein
VNARPAADYVERRYGAEALALLDEDAVDYLAAEELATLPAPKRLLDLPTPQPREHLIDGLLLRDEVNANVGDGDSGKTTTMLAGAGAVAAAALAYGELIVRPGPVLFVSGEDQGDEIQNHLTALAAGHGWDLRTTLSNFYVYDEGVDLDDPRWRERLVEIATDLHIVLACFDPIVDLCGDKVEENSNSDAKRVTRYLRSFMRRTGATPWLAMHVSKPSEGRTERKHRVRGASAWRNACRMVWWTEPCDGGIELDPIKANRLAKPQPLRIRRTVTTDPDHPLMWRAAHLGLDREGTVVHRDVVTLLGYIARCVHPPSGREVEDASGEHHLSRDKAREALAIGRTKGWLIAEPGPRRAQLWSLTEPGQARLMLDD